MFANILTVTLCNGFREALESVINMLHSIALLQDLIVMTHLLRHTP